MDPPEEAGVHPAAPPGVLSGIGNPGEGPPTLVRPKLGVYGLVVGLFKCGGYRLREHPLNCVGGLLCGWCLQVPGGSRWGLGPLAASVVSAPIVPGPKGGVGCGLPVHSPGSSSDG